MRVTLIGAGAIGGITGAYMQRNGVDVTLVEQSDEHREAIRRDGFQIDGIDTFTVRPPVLRPNDVRGPLELVIVAVKTQHTAAALDLIKPHLTTSGPVRRCPHRDGARSRQTVRVRRDFLKAWWAGSYPQGGVISVRLCMSLDSHEEELRCSQRLAFIISI